MINSPELSFGITRQHAQVGHKNINIFTYKNHLGRFCIKGKQFIQNDLQYNFVQFLAIFGTGTIHDLIHNISKNWTKDL
jgi:hypothetical protein